MPLMALPESILPLFTIVSEHCLGAFGVIGQHAVAMRLVFRGKTALQIISLDVIHRIKMRLNVSQPLKDQLLIIEDGVDSFVVLHCVFGLETLQPTWSARTVRERRVYEKKLERFSTVAVSRLVGCLHLLRCQGNILALKQGGGSR